MRTIVFVYANLWSKHGNKEVGKHWSKNNVDVCREKLQTEEASLTQFRIFTMVLAVLPDSSSREMEQSNGSKSYVLSAKRTTVSTDNSEASWKPSQILRVPVLTRNKAFQEGRTLTAKWTFTVAPFILLTFTRFDIMSFSICVGGVPVISQTTPQPPLSFCFDRLIILEPLHAHLVPRGCCSTDLFWCWTESLQTMPYSFLTDYVH